ncbi:hypothetical protein BJP36_22185 [Moorena producens JHB]|uniref:Uncharacterized protein n=1 Tax=Moorena producens (strain JHB) TaxID=1454205 RepID=A0A1D9G3J4_MOOP1|nr:hypothetical protein [Moorena producens]AOY82207.1 hypothetical protein BJP36_22185 [Moorena producens JHB]
MNPGKDNEEITIGLLVMIEYTEVCNWVRYKLLGFREQGAGSREQGRGKREEGKNTVYLIVMKNSVAFINEM